MSAQLDFAKFNQLAHSATRSAQFRFGVEVTARDYADMWQEAALAIWKAWCAGKADAYAFAAGRHAAIEWQRAWRGIKSHHKGVRTSPTFYARPLDDAEWHAYAAPQNDDGYILSDEVIEELFELMLNTRRAKGQKEIDGAVRAAHMMRLIAAGYNNLGIAQELHMTQDNVRFYRRHIRLTLQTLARAGGVA
jgi:DNA-binding CsgD family transcriptional regulator